MEPEAFLALMDQTTDVADPTDDAQADTWVAYHPLAGVFVGFQEERQLWSRVSPVVASSVVLFTKPDLGVTYLTEALDRHGFGSDGLEMYQVQDGTWPSLLAVGLPVEANLFEAVATVTATHQTTMMAQ